MSVWGGLWFAQESAVLPRLIFLEGIIDEYEVFEIIESGASGYVTPPAHATIILDQYPGLADCNIVKVDAATLKPIDEVVLDINGDAVIGTLSLDKSYILSAAPVAYPIAILYQIQLAAVYKIELDPNSIVNEMQLPYASKIAYDNTTSLLTSLNLQTAIDEIVDNLNMQSVNTQLVYVSKAGNDLNDGKTWHNSFLTIQAAINSITDATANKKYVIKIAVGDYAENVIAKDYVYLVGVDTNATRIVGSSGTLLTFPSTQFRFQNIGIILSNAADGSKCIDATAGGIHVIQNFETVIESTVNGAVCQFMDIDCFLFVAAEFSCSATMTGSAIGVRDKNYINIEGATIGSIARFAMNINDNDIDDNIKPIRNNTTGRVYIEAEAVEINATNPGYVGTTKGYDITGATSVNNTIRISSIILHSEGSGDGYAVFLNTGGSNGVAEIRVSSIKVTGFTNNYKYYIGLTDRLYAVSNIFNAISGSIILGQLIEFGINAITGEFLTTAPIVDQTLYIGDSTNRSLQDFFNILSSAGWVSGGEITNNGNGTVNISSGTGFIRTDNLTQAPIKMFNWLTTNNLILADNMSNLIYLDYNNGSPIVAVTTDELTVYDNEKSKFELYEIFREGNSLDIAHHEQRAVDVINQMQQYLYALAPIRRYRGLLLSEAAGRYIVLSEGRIFIKIRSIIISAKNTSLTDTFDRYYLTANTTWVKTTGNTLWDNLNYNTIATGLTEMTVGRDSYQDFYITGSGALVSVYATAQYNSQLEAETAPFGLLPPRLGDHSLWVGRIVFIKSGVVALSIKRPIGWE